MHIICYVTVKATENTNDWFNFGETIFSGSLTLLCAKQIEEYRQTKRLAEASLFIGLLD